MSANPVYLPNGSTYDFTTSESQAYIEGSSSMINLRD